MALLNNAIYELISTHQYESHLVSSSAGFVGCENLKKYKIGRLPVWKNCRVLQAGPGFLSGPRKLACADLPECAGRFNGACRY